jgi:multiple sugar transport system substrate-binding protein
MTATIRIAVRRFVSFETAIVRQFEDFVRTQGVDARIEIEPMDLNPLHEALFQRRELAHGQWDIAFVSTDWIAEAQALGLIEDLKPYLARQPIPDFPGAWSPSLLGLQSYAGGFWGMPYHDGPQCLIYRKDLLAAAGIAVPETWDDFHAAARRLHDPAQGRFGTVLALFPDGHNAFYDFCIHLWTRGGAPFDAQGRPQMNSPPAIAALDFLRALAKDTAAVAPGLRDIDSVKSGVLFCEGKLALMANWFGFAAFGESWPESKVAGKIDIAPLPAGPGGRSVSLNVFWMLTMASGSRHKDIVWDFMRHCATAPMDKITTLEGAIGVRRSTWADAEVNRAVPYYHKLDQLHARARELPVHPKLSAISHVVDEMMGEAIAGDRPSAVLLAIAHGKIEDLLR